MDPELLFRIRIQQKVNEQINENFNSNFRPVISGLCELWDCSIKYKMANTGSY